MAATEHDRETPRVLGALVVVGLLLGACASPAPRSCWTIQWTSRVTHEVCAEGQRIEVTDLASRDQVLSRDLFARSAAEVVPLMVELRRDAPPLRQLLPDMPYDRREGRQIADDGPRAVTTVAVR